MTKGLADAELPEPLWPVPDADLLDEHPAARTVATAAVMISEVRTLDKRLHVATKRTSCVEGTPATEGRT